MKIIILLLILLGLISCGKKSDSSSHNRDRRQDEVTDLTFQEEYIDLLNNYRASIGLKKLKYELKIEKVADGHSAYMAGGIGRFGHRGWRTRCNDLMRSMQGRSCSEIVAMGQKTPKDVLYAWIQSPSHRKAVENPRVTHTGLGIRQNHKGIIYWTQIFIEKP